MSLLPPGGNGMISAHRLGRIVLRGGEPWSSASKHAGRPRVGSAFAFPAWYVLPDLALVHSDASERAIVIPP